MTNDLIYDVGMHNGNDTAFYLACGFRVIAIEADPDLVAAAKIRFKAEIKSNRLQILNVAIAEQAGVALFWINEEISQLNSFDRELTSRFAHPVHSIEVQCSRLDRILLEHGTPHYLKIDIEGHDLVCCSQLSPENKPKYISVEMSRIDLLVKLQELGYDRFKLVDQTDLRPITPGNTKLKKRLLRRIHRVANYRKDARRLHLRFVRSVAASALRIAASLGMWGPAKPFKSRMLPGWNFVERTCSGTFGEDLPGGWLRSAEILHIWRRDVSEYKKIGEELWCDLHATDSKAS